jgi:hypothetical protein
VEDYSPQMRAEDTEFFYSFSRRPLRLQDNKKCKTEILKVHLI